MDGVELVWCVPVGKWVRQFGLPPDHLTVHVGVYVPKILCRELGN